MSHLPTVWLKENQVRLVGSSRSFTCNYTKYILCFHLCQLRSWVVLVPINICFWGLCCKGILCPSGKQVGRAFWNALQLVISIDRPPSTRLTNAW